MGKFNLNADMAEGYGPWQMGNDDGMLDVIGSANIACGFHAGDYNIMGEVMLKAAAKGVDIGSHPGFYDLHGFGRRQYHLSDAEVERLISYQLGASLGMAALTGTTITHIKPHGAISNMACADAGLAAAIMRGIKAVAPSLILLSPAKSELIKEARKAGFVVAEELFADRAYMPDGQLAPRSRPDAMIHDPDASLAHVMRMFAEGEVLCVDGSVIAMEGQSVCVHGDGPTALKTAQYIRQGLEAAGFEMCGLDEICRGS